MDEKRFAEAVRAAAPAPKTPESLYERTLQAARAVQAGREAEQKLEAMGSAPAGQEGAVLGARAVSGRLCRTILPPAGATPEKMSMQLLASDAFRRECAHPADVLLSRIRSGELQRSLTAGAQRKAAAQGPAPERGLEGTPRV